MILSLDEKIKEVFQKLDFQFNQEESSSIFFVSDLSTSSNLPPKIAIDLDKAKIFGATAVYFRFFDGNRMPQPQIYIYSNTNEDPAEIQKNIWSASEIPIFIIIDDSIIKIYNSRKPVEIKENGTIFTKPLKTFNIKDISNIDEAVALYRAEQFNSGSFWESDETSKEFIYNNTSYQILIKGLKSVRKHLKEKIGISQQLSDHLLILSILVRYLEENGIDDDKKNLAKKFFSEKIQCDTFTEAIRHNKLLELFDLLSEHFNGGVFSLNVEQKKELLKVGAKLSILANFLEGKLDSKNQTIIWSQYSFKYIPIELISNFYEEFIPKENKKGTDKEENKKDTGAVYTPSYLVNFLVDECLPITKDNLDYKVKLIDVSCGSGIFLVTAFKRLVQRWRVKNMTNGKLANPSPNDLKNILKDNIYGIDTNATATDLTMFSLNLSICSMLTPKQIWTNLKFDDLKSKNIKNQDFFDAINENSLKGFDLVIGNPPFKSINIYKYKEYEEKLNKIDKGFLCKIPDNQYALMFLDKAMELLKSTGLLCLILPAGPMLYNNTLNFREKFFKKYNIPQIIDFTFLRNTLFNTANVATIALFAQNIAPDDKDILHLTIKRTKTAKEKHYFEIDHYDFHYVSKRAALNNDYIWKANLVGGDRVYNLIEKIKQKSDSTLAEFLKEQGLKYGQGYIVGKKENSKGAEYITNKNTVIIKSFNEEGNIAIEKQTIKLFKDISNEEYFTSPHILIKKDLGHKRIPIVYREDYLTFTNRIIGIHSSEQDKDILKEIIKVFNKNQKLYRFYIVATSGEFGVVRTPYTILTEDIYNLPYFHNKLILSKSDEIVINDINYVIESFSRGENASINKIAKRTDLDDFSNIYCLSLNTIYKEDNKEYYLHTIYKSNSYFACEYQFSNKRDETKYVELENDFSNLLNNWNSRNALIKRVVRIYDTDKIILIKPKQLRYWLKSIALRDADETLSETFN